MPNDNKDGYRTTFGTLKERYSFDHVVQMSGYRNVVTTNYPPEIYVHYGQWVQLIAATHSANLSAGV